MHFWICIYAAYREIVIPLTTFALFFILSPGESTVLYVNQHIFAYHWTPQSPQLSGNTEFCCTKPKQRATDLVGVTFHWSDKNNSVNFGLNIFEQWYRVECWSRRRGNTLSLRRFSGKYLYIYGSKFRIKSNQNRQKKEQQHRQQSLRIAFI